MRIVILLTAALTLSGCGGGSPMAVESRTGFKGGMTPQQALTLRLNSCVNGASERCDRGGGG